MKKVLKLLMSFIVIASFFNVVQGSDCEYICFPARRAESRFNNCVQDMLRGGLGVQNCNSENEERQNLQGQCNSCMDTLMNGNTDTGDEDGDTGDESIEIVCPQVPGPNGECRPAGGECARQDKYCTGGIGSCELASNGYTVPYCVSSNGDYANACNFESLTNSLSAHLREASFNTKDMISQYCASLLGCNQNGGRIYYAKPSLVDSGWDWSMTFDSHQSMFVYALCSSFKNKSGSFVTLDSSFSKVFKGDVTKLLKLQQRSKGKDQCSLVDSPTLDECDMSSYATEIFSAIMSDIFKIKYAQVFHVDSVDLENQNKKERMITFLSGYFSKVDENFLDMFPDTIDAIDSNQKYYKKVLEKLKLLDNSILANRAKELGCPATGNIVGVDFVACALHGSQGNGSSLDPAFETLFYNEMLHYRIFVSYYWNWMEGKIGNNAVSNDRKVELQSKAIDLQAYSNLQIEAAQQTLHDFEDLTMTYPLHVGLLLYQEKLREFRNQYLPPVVQLFYSLSEKLQNVQLPN